MAKEYNIKVPGVPSIYQPAERELEIYFCEPEQGINEDTGILLLIAGYGATAESKVYQKMRKQFADKYNLVTVQCNYFGYEFMQSPRCFRLDSSPDRLREIFEPSDYDELFKNNSLNLMKLLQLGSKYTVSLTAQEQMTETLSNFNDMGIMQALDNISALLILIATIYDNGYTFNVKRVISYGHSHGAYLCHLCNALAPTLFSLIVDNSAWLFPAYLKQGREYTINRGKLTLKVVFDYLARKYPFDEELLFLPSLYSKFTNQSNIITFQGTTDHLVSYQDKYAFCKNIEFCKYVEISQEKIDDQIFKSTNHGLDADFLNLFEYVFDNDFFEFKKSFDLNLPGLINIETKLYKYFFDYRNGMPVVSRQRQL